MPEEKKTEVTNSLSGWIRLSPTAIPSSKNIVSISKCMKFGPVRGWQALMQPVDYQEPRSAKYDTRLNKCKSQDPAVMIELRFIATLASGRRQRGTLQRKVG